MRDLQLAGHRGEHKEGPSARPQYEGNEQGLPACLELLQELSLSESERPGQGLQSENEYAQRNGQHPQREKDPKKRKEWPRAETAHQPIAGRERQDAREVHWYS